MKMIFTFLILLIFASCNNLFHYNNEKEEMKLKMDTLSKRMDSLQRKVDSIEKNNVRQ